MDGTVTFLRWPQEEYKILSDVHIELDGEDMGLIQDEDVSFLLTDGQHSVRMYRSVGKSVMDDAKIRFILADGEHVTVRYRPSLVAGQGSALTVSGCKTFAASEQSVRPESSASGITLGTIFGFIIFVIFIIFAIMGYVVTYVNF